jgi:hypothetical protein
VNVLSQVATSLRVSLVSAGQPSEGGGELVHRSPVKVLGSCLSCLNGSR